MTGSRAFSQKKPLDPTVYDGWQRIGERVLSADGKYIAYTVVPQEGDGRLYIRATGDAYAKEIPRGGNVEFTADGRYAVFLIRPFFKDTREARIKKKPPEQMPKESLAWIELGTDSIVRIPRVRSYKLPDLQGDWLAYLLEKPEAPAVGPGKPDSLTRIRQLTARADSLSRLVDSLRRQIQEVSARGWAAIPAASAKKESRSKEENGEEGTELVVRNLVTGGQMKFPLTSEYYFNRNGNTLVVETTRKSGDSLSRAHVIWVSTANGHADTIMTGFNDARNYALDEAGGQLAFVAERDSATKALSKSYRLWYYTPGMDSAAIRADRTSIAAAITAAGDRLSYPHIPGYVSMNAARHTPAFIDQLTVSPDYLNYFSKDGGRLFFGLAPVRPPKDTTLVEFETARLDVWNYNDDYLSPEQLVRLPNEIKRSYLAVLPKGSTRFIPLADENCEVVRPGEKGMGKYALGMSNKEYRIQQQWEQSGLEKVWLVDVGDGSRKLIRDKVRDGASLSPGGKYVLWYDPKERNWYTYEIATGAIHNITAGIRAPLYDEEDDHPDDPPPHGTMGWLEDDRYVYIYDKYDIWQCDPAGGTGGTAPVDLTGGVGRRHQLTFRYVGLDREDPVIHAGQQVLLTVFNNRDKTGGLTIYKMGAAFPADTALTHPLSHTGFLKARNNWTLAWLQGSFDKPYDIWVSDAMSPAVRLSHINPQQAGYNWLTVELKHWKMLDGRMSEGLLYKPENFDSTKKYPIIFYFYERDADNLYNYQTPSPDRSIINIPYFVSNGYLVFDPNIYYKTGAPGEDAYNSVISAARYLSHFKWVDTTKMGLEGHSWGGYQVAYLVTRTHLFAAAEAGAPVANMTSAYGGIRWGSGISRQFQYERTQSRIGSTLWQHPELYIKSSPLFRADKVTTPLLMMHNDADGSVPWYQGIEYFTALRRLGKKAWLIEYNGEDHGLTERRNQKDWSLRMSQFFDYYLKGEPPARWITDGVPATLKGIDWGLETP
ncbi:MAG TPA: prolyl oligopeptidase family serine peptidase [Puia sp.]|nr:prolyl oligopeptidase family serine peptidase [Puia sp.]